MKRYNVHVIGNHKYVSDTSAGEYVDADIAQSLYDCVSRFVDAVMYDVIKVGPNNREFLIELLKDSNEALSNADKD